MIHSTRWAEAAERCRERIAWNPRTTLHTSVHIGQRALVQFARRFILWRSHESNSAIARFSSLDELFEGRHFDRAIIVLCVRWYLRFKLSLRDLVEMMAERGLSMAHTTIMRWVQRYAPKFVKRWNRFGRPTGRSWRVDETYVMLRGRWVYLYRAVDRACQTVNFRLSARRDVAAAKAFFKKAIRGQGRPPHTIALDGYVASHRAVREMKADGVLAEDTTLRSSKYLNNLIEQDHRNIKSRVAVMLGFRYFKNAVITIAGIELMHRIRKGQFNIAARFKEAAAPACLEGSPFGLLSRPKLLPSSLLFPICTIAATSTFRAVSLRSTEESRIKDQASSAANQFYSLAF